MGALDLIAEASADWREARRSRRLRQRRLPHGLREAVERIRRDDLADSVLDLIFEAVEREAKKLEAKDPKRLDFARVGSRQVVLPVVERQVLRQLSADAAFRGKIRNEIASALREAHRQLTNPSEAETVPTLVLSEAPVPDDGRLVLRSSIGLGTATFLEGEPEDWDVFVVSRAVGARDQDEEDVTLDDRAVHIYAVGAGSGGLARAVTALDLSGRIEVEEFDRVLPESTVLSCVVGDRSGTLRRNDFDLLALVLPAPGMDGAVNYRRIYRKDGNRAEFDLSTLGPKRWMAEVQGWIGVVPELLTDDGLAFALVPAAIRQGVGYVAAPELLEAVLEAADQAGLQVVERLRVVELEPVNQPFVGRNRPERWSLTVRQAKSAEGRDA